VNGLVRLIGAPIALYGDYVMRRLAWVYVISVLASAALLSMFWFVVRPAQFVPGWLFWSLTAITSVMRISVIDSPRHRSYEGSTIGLVAGFLLLPPWLFVLQVVLAHVAEWTWVRSRTPTSTHLLAWYIQPFNMAKCVLGGASAYLLLALLPFNKLGPLSAELPFVVLLILTTYVVVNQALLGLALLLARGISFRQAGVFRDGLLTELPLACIGFVAVELYALHPILSLLVLGPMALIYQALLLPKLQAEAVQQLEQVNQELTVANSNVRELNAELFLTLAKIFDARDPFVGGHAAQVAIYAVAIATDLALSPDQIEVIRQAALLHDIGKIAIPESILHKPERLTEAEYAFLKRHTDIGADFIATSKSLQHLAPFVRYHHERWDGKGYPCGLAREAIPLEARILNLCDSVEAMASDRPYHHAMSMVEIITEIRQCIGEQFDPVVAGAFIRVAQRLGAGFIVNSARTVVAQHSGDPKESDLTLALFTQAYGMRLRPEQGQAE
jgi:putative nucleotidyltransferase with HDIG domain